MDNRLFLMSGESAVEMRERSYESEDALQKIVEDNPHLLARVWGEDECRLFLVKREFGIMESEDSSNSYSLDHLFIGEDAVPVLVEVKRSTDTRIRREVVGQMLDYACRACTWDASELRKLFRASNPETNLAEIDTDEFWERVATNLRAEHLRLIFVADRIPDTLRVLIEFLGRNMDGIEVYGIALRRYATPDAFLLSSNIVGNSTPDNQHPASNRRQWNDESFAAYLCDKRMDELQSIVRWLWDYAAALGLNCAYGRSVQPLFTAKIGSTIVFTVSVWHRNPVGDVCTIELGVKYIAEELENAVSEESIRSLFKKFPNSSAAHDQHLLWDTPYYLYLDLRSLAKDEDIAVLGESLETLCDTIAAKEGVKYNKQQILPAPPKI